jgi:hypothetical protein
MDAAVFQATYADWKLIKGRKVVQVVFEVPIEKADAAYNVVGGMPNPGTEGWFAIARLTEQAGQAPRQQPEPTAPLPAGAHSYAQRLGIACGERSFWRFLTEERLPASRAINIQNENDAADAVRYLIGCKRREAIDGTPGGTAARELLVHYQNWLKDVA